MFRLDLSNMQYVLTQCELYALCLDLTSAICNMLILNVNYMLNVYTQCELYAQCLYSM